MATGNTIVVRGLAETVRGFGRLDAGLRRELQAEIKGIAADVAEVARGIAAEQGLRDTGALIRKTKPAVKGARGFVRSTASRAGFPYPAVYEYGRERSRAFLEPALDRENENVVRRLEDMLERLTSSEGFGAGGML